MYTEPIDKSLMAKGITVFGQETHDEPDTSLMNKPLRSEYFSFILIRAGWTDISMNFHQYRFSPGEIVFLPPGAVCECNEASPDCTIIGMAFTGDYAQQSGLFMTSTDALDILVGNDLSPSLLLTQDEYSNSLALMQLIQRKLNDPDNSWNQKILQHAFLTLMLELNAAYSKIVERKRPPMSSGENSTVRFISLLGKHYKTQRSVQFYADAMHLSARHLSQVIKQVTGKTAGQLIDDAIMQEARILLTNPAYNVTQIAELLHFSNASVFGKFFRSQAGISPSQFRQEN